MTNYKLVVTKLCKILLVAVNIALAGLLSVIEAQWGLTSGARGNGETRERREGAQRNLISNYC